MIDESFDQLLDTYLKSKAVMEEMEAAKKVVEQAIMDKLREMKLTGTTVKGYNLQKVMRSSYSEVSLSVARELGCTKTEEKPDGEKLRKLEANGVKIAGVKRIQYLLVKEAK